MSARPTLNPPTPSPSPQSSPSIGQPCRQRPPQNREDSQAAHAQSEGLFPGCGPAYCGLAAASDVGGRQCFGGTPRASSRARTRPLGLSDSRLRAGIRHVRCACVVSGSAVDRRRGEQIVSRVESHDVLASIQAFGLLWVEEPHFSAHVCARVQSLLIIAGRQ